MRAWLVPLVLPYAGFAGTARWRAGALWTLLRLSLLWATPPVVLAFSRGHLGAPLLAALVVHALVALLNAWHAQKTSAGPGSGRASPAWHVVCALGVLGAALFTATRVVALQTVETDDLRQTFPRGTTVVVDLWNRHFSEGDVVWHRCLDAQPRCIHRILVMGPERVEPLDSSMEKAVLVPDHWLFILSDIGVAGEDSRTIGPMPPTNVVGRAHRW
jgi:hypothetical protein